MNEIEMFKKRISQLVKVSDINELIEITENKNEWVSVRNIAHALIVDFKSGTFKNTLAIIEFIGGKK